MLNKYIVEKVETTEALGTVQDICSITNYTEKDLLKLNENAQINFVYKNRNLHGGKFLFLPKERKILRYRLYYTLSPLRYKNKIIQRFLEAYCFQKVYLILYSILCICFLFCIYLYHGSWYEYIISFFINAFSVYSIALHELGHIFMCKLCKVKYSITMSGMKVSVHSVTETYKKNIAIAIAGAGINMLIALAVITLLLMNKGFNFMFGLEMCCSIHFLHSLNILPIFKDGKNIIENLRRVNEEE